MSEPWFYYLLSRSEIDLIFSLASLLVGLRLEKDTSPPLENHTNRHSGILHLPLGLQSAHYRIMQLACVTNCPLLTCKVVISVTNVDISGASCVFFVEFFMCTLWHFYLQLMSHAITSLNSLPCGSCIYMYIYVYMWPAPTKWVLSRFWKVLRCLHFQKVHLKCFKMTPQPCFYLKWFRRYGLEKVWSLGNMFLRKEGLKLGKLIFREATCICLLPSP